MVVDYKSIRKDNIKKYGEDKRHLEIYGILYSDRTHFIYELLQNAEDAKATKVDLSLFDDKFVLEHNGRKFSETDIRSICGIGEGLKAEDFTAIGRFGIGFKSVYAITNNPEIHSDKDHFRIKNYIRPYECEIKNASRGYTTLFVLPFDNEESENKAIFNDIKESLLNMPTHTILFLKNIESIKMSINGHKVSSISKKMDTGKDDLAHKIVLSHGARKSDSFLLFSKQVPHKTKGLTVQIAYSLTADGAVKRSESTNLIVFFPTDLPTNLGFLVQGPYRTTPARDNIPHKDEFNKTLIDITSDLMIESLRWLKTHKLLKESIYNLLPYEEVNFPLNSLFRPFYEKLRKGFRDHDLLMTSTFDAEGFVVFSNSKAILMTRNIDLRQLIDAEMLKEITYHQYHYWLSDRISENTTPGFYKYLKSDLGIPMRQPEDMIKHMYSFFLDKQTNAWMMELYKFILSQRQWIKELQNRRGKTTPVSVKHVPFLDVPIVRLQDGNHVSPFKKKNCLEPSAYLPNNDGGDYRFVMKEVLEDYEVLEFFKILGYTEPSEVEYCLEYILPDLGKKLDLPGDFTGKIALARKIIIAWTKANSEQRKVIDKSIEELKWLPAYSFSEETTPQLVNHKVCYTSNQDIVNFLHGSAEHYRVSPELIDLQNELIEMGVSDDIRVEYCKPDAKGYVKIYSNSRGLNGFDARARIDGFHCFIGNRSLSNSRYLWNDLLIPHIHLIKGDVESSSNGDYRKETTIETQYSSVGLFLCGFPWIPGKDNQFYKPSDLCMNDLPEGFKRNSDLANALDMKQQELDPVRDLAAKIGFPDSLIKELSENPESNEEIAKLLKTLLDKRKRSKRKDLQNNVDDDSPEDVIDDDSKPFDFWIELRESFKREQKPKNEDALHSKPDTVINPDGRMDHDYLSNKERITNSRKVEDRFKITNRRIIEGPNPAVRTKLQNWYGGKCQFDGCKNSFTQSNGEPFFVAHYLVPRKRSDHVDNPGNALCLCAEHFARLLHGSLSTNDFVSQMQGLNYETKQEVHFKLCGLEETLRFHKEHVIALHAYLEALKIQPRLDEKTLED